MSESNNAQALENILGEQNELTPPVSRINAILQNILGASYDLETPVSRNGALLKDILDMGFVPEQDVYGEILLESFGS